jgi:hypothetical protein
MALYAVLTALAVAAVSRIAWPPLTRLRAVQASRRARIAQIEASYERDMNPAPPVRTEPVRRPMTCIVSPDRRTALHYIHLIHKDPREFRIITEPERMMSLPQGVRVIMMGGQPYRREFLAQFDQRLRVLRADVWHVSLDDLLGVRR